MVSLAAACALLIGGLLQSSAVSASSWPQWGGPHRNFTLPDTKVAQRWPAAGPPVIWKRPLGEGHSSIVGDSRHLVTMYRKDDRELVIALDAATGKTIWEFGYTPLTYERLDPSYGRGPHCDAAAP